MTAGWVTTLIASEVGCRGTVCNKTPEILLVNKETHPTPHEEERSQVDVYNTHLQLPYL